MFDSRSFSTTSFSSVSFDFGDVIPEAVVTYGGWRYHPWLYEKQAKEELEELAEELVEELNVSVPVVAAITTAVKVTVADRQYLAREQDLQAVERTFRASLAALEQRWIDDYYKLLSLAYRQEELEREELQIIWLLFEQ